MVDYGSFGKSVCESAAVIKSLAVSTDGWEVHTKASASNGGVLMEYQDGLNDSPERCYRLFGQNPNKSPHELCDLLWSWGKNEWNREGDVLDWVIYKESPRMLYQRNKLPWPVADRDFVMEIGRFTDLNTKGQFLAMKSVIDEEKAPRSDGTVRANAILSAFYFMPHDSGTGSTIIRIAQIDSQGSIPSAIKKMAASAQIKSIQGLCKL
uniref:START domain-containing protein n=1 Tax=Timspurckia oligopyrenoides TaxID=708627 RepID=A0A7S0ZL62_9RHOD|mmetsp:Transcript_9595/g.17290  ORF Transcript_9595/g.17290 Transcript_9595/m.17290 type:complete len:209 (+) Transcript_9595:38-664(+)